MPDPNNTPATKTTEELAEQLAKHLSEYAEHRLEYLERQLHQDQMQASNLKAISDLTTATKGLVDAWTVANNLQRFVVWVSKFAILAGVFTYFSGKFGFKLP